MRHIFVSPHMDDVVLSAANHILKLRKENWEVIIVSVFTEYGHKFLSADDHNYVKRSGFADLNKFTSHRKEEDYRAMKMLDVESIHLGFIDGGFRQHEQKAIYPHYNAASLFSGVVAQEDLPILEKIEQKLLGIVTKDDIVYGPMGIGNHVDHVIVKTVLDQFENRKYYWQDQPYAWGIKTKPRKSKLEIVNCYDSQVKCVFDGRVRLKKEVFKLVQG